MDTIYILTSSLTGSGTNLITASPDREFLRDELKRHVKEYLGSQDNYPDNDPTAVKRRQELLAQLDTATDHWDDGEESYLLEYDIVAVSLLTKPLEPLPPPTARQAVVEQIVAMFENNILQENGPEQFTGWCEDGDVFHNGGYDDMPNDTKDDCVFLMNEVAPHVDKITEILTEPIV